MFKCPTTAAIVPIDEAKFVNSCALPPVGPLKQDVGSGTLPDRTDVLLPAARINPRREHMPFFIFVVCLVTVNVWMTRRILRASDHFDHKGLHIIMVWIAPFIRALLTHGHVRPSSD